MLSWKKKVQNHSPWPKMAADRGPGFAPAKINLTLHVTGQRADGYHLLESLVVFVDVGDLVRCDPQQSGLQVSGPFGHRVPTGAENLVHRAKALIAPDLDIGIHLEKYLPPASGIGGGSSDAAATLRLLQQECGLPLPPRDQLLSLGADLPVCLAARTCRMSGVGEKIEDIEPIPPLHLLLVNPGVDVSTPAVFHALRSKCNAPMSDMPGGPDLHRFCTWLNHQRNDLQTPAITLAPAIRTVLDTIRETHPFCVRMSGSGATCFGVYETATQAADAAKLITAEQPGWWVAAAKTI